MGEVSRQWRITCEVGEVENSPQGGEEVGTGGAGLSIVMIMIMVTNMGMMMVVMEQAWTLSW